jgi:hypothetical protein
MKKIILSIALLAIGITLFAQNETNYTTTNTGNYNAYNAPNNLRMKFQSAYPNAINVTWQPMNTWWVATYTADNRLAHVYYGPNGTSFSVALPAIETQVPEGVITKAINQFGNNMYDITMMKGPSNNTIYMVRLMENGNIRSTWMNEDGSTVTDVFVHH